jgi:transposase
MALPIELRERVVAAYQDGLGSYEHIAEIFDVAICSVRRWVELFKNTGRIDRRLAPGAEPRIKDDQLAELVKLVEEKPDRTVNELCMAWQERTGEIISPSAMNRALARAGMSLKKRHSVLRNARVRKIS